MKVVKNVCYDVFDLSDGAIELYFDKKGITYNNKKDKMLNDFDYYVDERLFDACNIEKHDSVLVKVIEELGNKANSNFSD